MPHADGANGTSGTNGSGEGTERITLKIGGMMCGHCEKRVRDALEALPGVTACGGQPYGRHGGRHARSAGCTEAAEKGGSGGRISGAVNL